MRGQQNLLIVAMLTGLAFVALALAMIQGRITFGPSFAWLVQAPTVLGFIVMALAWNMARVRMLIASVTLITISVLSPIVWEAGVIPDSVGALAYALLMILLPLGWLAVDMMLSEDLIDRDGMVPVGFVVAVPLALPIGIILSGPSSRYIEGAWAVVYDLLYADFLPALPTAVSALPDVGLFIVAEVLLIQSIRAMARPSSGRISSLCSFALLMLGMLMVHQPIAAGACFTLSALMLILYFAIYSWADLRLDPLTGLPGRRALLARLDQGGHVGAFGIVIIDNLPEVRRNHGHEVATQMVRMVASELDRVSRRGMVFRHSDESFALVYGDGAKARAAFDEAVASVARRPFRLRGARRPILLLPLFAWLRRKPVSAQPAMGVTVSLAYYENQDVRSGANRLLRDAEQEALRLSQTGGNRAHLLTS